MKNLLYILFTVLLLSGCNDFDIADQGFDLEALPESVSFNAPGDDWDASTSEVEGDTVTLSVEAAAGTLADIEVTYSLGGTAEFGVDYTIEGATATGGTVTIDHDPADFNDFDMGDIVIALANDDNQEGNETIEITLLSALRGSESIEVGRGGTEFGRTAIVTITDDTLTFSLSAARFTTTESAVGDTITFFASLNFAAGSAVTYDLTSTGTLTAGSNFNFVGGVSPGTGLSIAAGESADTVTIVLVDNGDASTTPQGLDSIQFEISNVAIGSGDIEVGNDETTVFVQDDAVEYGFSLSADTITLNQIGTYNYRVTLIDTVTNAATPAFSDVIIPYTTNQGDATVGVDFADLSGGAITIPQGESIADISIQVLQVGQTGDPTVTVILENPTTSYAEVLGVTALDTLQLQID